MINIDFTGKNVLLTGAGGGIGGGIARAYAKAGARVHLADLKLEAMDRIVAEFKAAGYNYATHALDVTDEPAVNKLVESIVAEDGKLDMLCNCAGIVANAYYMDTTAETFEKVLAVNLVGMHKCIQAALKHMLPAGAGKIVNIASASTRKGVATQSAYSASKFGVQSLTQSVALTAAASNINVNAICPGLVFDNSGMYESTVSMIKKRLGTDSEEKTLEVMKSWLPTRRFQTPDDIGNAAVFLSSDLAVNITGQALNVDGGFFMN
ncbi:MAG: SDR family oxidoreductase [Ruminococcaceae bacterium]|nr:SDR family oxidoreductase [Oscillospiraceae bacterium]